jgi:hypothetical protein
MVTRGGLFLRLPHARRGVQANIEEKIHNSADYAGMDPAMARLDFADRVKKYEAVYEPIGVGSSPTRPGGNGTYIKLIDTASGSGHMQVCLPHLCLPL